MILAIWAAVVALAVVAVNAARRQGYARWFHPLSLPLAAITVMSLGGPLWVYLTHRPSGLLYDPGHAPLGASLLQVPLSGIACAALVLVIGGYFAGAGLALTMISPAEGRPAPPFRYQRMRQAGLALMAAAAGGRLLADFLGRGHSYGVNQFQYGPGAALAAAASEMVLPGLILVTMMAFGPEKPERMRDLLRGREWLALSVYALAVAGAGERSGLIAPAVYLAWAYGTQVRAIRVRWVIASVVVALAFGAVISGYRSGGGVRVPSPGVMAQDGAGDVSSAAWLTEQTVIHVPSAFPFAHGATYAAALEAQVPGPVARKTGATSRTAAAEFRDIISYSDPDQGFSEAFPAEAYLNFGMAGCVGAGMFLGFLLGWAWRRHRVPGFRAQDVLYPLLLAGLVYGFRSDALTQVKEVLYPALTVCAVVAWCRLRGNADVQESPLASRTSAQAEVRGKDGCGLQVSHQSAVSN